MEDGDSSAGSNSKRKGLCCLFSHRMTANYVYDTALKKGNISIGCRKERRGKFKCFMESPCEGSSRTKHSSAHPNFGAITSDLGNIQLVPRWGAKHTFLLPKKTVVKLKYHRFLQTHHGDERGEMEKYFKVKVHVHKIKGCELGNTGL